MVELILIRHAESTMSGRYVGRTDPPLSARGYGQAAALGRRLSTRSISAVYASPLRRTLDTARAIAEPHGLEVESVADLAELDFGDWDGLTYEEIKRRDPEALARWLDEPSVVHPPGGETLAQMSQRVIAASQGIVTRHPQHTVAIVSHGGPIRAIICHALDLPVHAHWRIRQDLAAITCLDWHGTQATLWLLNDVCHLHEACQCMMREQAHE